MKRTVRVVCLITLVMVVSPLASCADLIDDLPTSMPGRGDRISCQIICDGMGGDFRNFDAASSVADAESACEEIVDVDPIQYSGACEVDQTPTACSCFAEE